MRCVTMPGLHKSEEPPYKRKTVPDLTDTELRRKLCVRGKCHGCAGCEVLDWCEYGKETIRREKNAV